MPCPNPWEDSDHSEKETEALAKVVGLITFDDLVEMLERTEDPCEDRMDHAMDLLERLDDLKHTLDDLGYDQVTLED